MRFGILVKPDGDGNRRGNSSQQNKQFPQAEGMVHPLRIFPFPLLPFFPFSTGLCNPYRRFHQRFIINWAASGLTSGLYLEAISGRKGRTQGMHKHMFIG